MNPKSLEIKTSKYSYWIQFKNLHIPSASCIIIISYCKLQMSYNQNLASKFVNVAEGGKEYNLVFHSNIDSAVLTTLLMLHGAA